MHDLACCVCAFDTDLASYLGSYPAEEPGYEANTDWYSAVCVHG